MDIMNTMFIVGIVFLIIGLILVGVEMIVPGFGAPGISGGICLVVGVFLSSKSVEQALTIVVIVLVIMAVMLMCVVLLFNKKKIKSPIMLEEQLQAKGQFMSAEDLNYLVGKEGVTTTNLRPQGTCDIDGISFEVVSDGNLIKRGATVKIIKVANNKLVVSEI